MFSPTRPPVLPSSLVSASAAPASRDLLLLKLARAVEIYARLISSSFRTSRLAHYQPPLSKLHHSRRATPGGVVHKTPRRVPLCPVRCFRARSLHTFDISLNHYNPSKPDPGFENWKIQVAYPRRNPPTPSSIAQSPTIHSSLTHPSILHPPPPRSLTVDSPPSFPRVLPNPQQSSRSPANVLTKPRVRVEDQSNDSHKRLIPTIYLGRPLPDEDSEVKVEDPSHESLEEFLEEFKDVEMTLAAVSTCGNPSSFGSGVESIALDTTASISSSESLRSISRRSDSFQVYPRTVTNPPDEDPADRWPTMSSDFASTTLDHSYASYHDSTTSIKSTNLEDSFIDVKTTIVTPAPTQEESSESLQDLAHPMISAPFSTIPTICAILTSSESATVSSSRPQHPDHSSIASTTLYNPDLQSATVAFEKQRVFDLKSATPVHDLVKSLSKSPEDGASITRTPPSTRSVPNAFSKPLEAPPSSNRQLKDLPANSPTSTVSDSSLTISKDRVADNLIRSLEDLLARPAHGEDQDVANPSTTWTVRRLLRSFWNH